MNIETIKLEEKFQLFQDHWNPRILTDVNNQLVKIAKLKGEFVWHKHEDEDELFLVVKGQLHIDLRDQSLTLNPGELTVIPKGVEHRPWADEETWILLLEPTTILHTGDTPHELTNNQQERI